MPRAQFACSVWRRRTWRRSSAPSPGQLYIKRQEDLTDGGGNALVWAHNGRELFYLSGGSMNVVEIRPGPPFTVGPLRVLFARPDRVREGSPIGGTFDIAPDDQRFLMVRNVTPGDTIQTATLVMVQNFFEELKAKVGR